MARSDAFVKVSARSQGGLVDEVAPHRRDFRGPTAPPSNLFHGQGDTGLLTVKICGAGIWVHHRLSLGGRPLTGTT